MIKSLLQTVSFSALAAVFVAAPQVAMAQSEPVQSEVEVEEVVVTARLREENVQRVPVAITALSAEDLAERNISSLADLSNSTPGIAITTIAGGTLTNVFVRGQAPANTTTDLNVAPNVAIFIDDIYQTSRNTVDVLSVLDVGQIQIAKGPQSALFGRSAFAGALSISTRRPADILEGSVQATIGTDEDYRLRGSLSAPLGDTLRARISAGYMTYDGDGENSADPDDNLGGVEKYAASGSLEYRPSSEFTARLSGFLFHSKSELSPASLLPLAQFNCGTLNAATGLRTVYCGELEASDVSSQTPGAPDTVAQARQVSLNLNWRRDGVSVTSITGWTEAENRTYNDYDGTAIGTLFGVCTLPAACSPAGAYSRLVRANALSTSRERVRTFSQEIRLQSDYESPFQWILGANYFNSRIPLAAGGIGVAVPGLLPNERLVQVSQIVTPAATGIGAYDFTANPFLVADQNAGQLHSAFTQADTKTFSIFGSLSYQFGDFRISAEGRYNVDRKRAQVFSVSNPLSAPRVNQAIDGVNVPEPGTFPVAGPLFARTFNSFAPRVTVDYQATRDIFFYASAAKGVRSGGFNTVNPVGPTGILADEVAYEEETNWTYEAGIKSRLFNRALLFNASVFHVDWTNAQVSAFTLNPTTVNPTRIVRNAGNLKTNGFEVESELRLGFFSFGGSVVYSDAEFQAGAYDASIVAQCVIGVGAAAVAAPGCPPVILVTTPSGVRAVTSLEGNRPQRSVKWQWNLHAAADMPLTADWRLFARVDVNHTGDAPFNLTNTALFGERTLTNARIAVENDRFSIALWANNIFDVLYTANAIGQPRAGVPFVFSVPEIYRGEGRRVGVTVGAKF